MTISSRFSLQQFAPWVPVLACAIIALAAYSQALDYPFISDDISYVVTNKALAGLQTGELWRLLVVPYNIGFEFLPIRDLSYWIDITLFGQNPAGFRLHNMLLFLLCLPLVYAVTAELWRQFRPQEPASAPWVAAAVTSMFALHPALVESVVWISGRKYILPDFFSMLALLFALKTKGENGFKSGYALATLAAFGAVMFSKASYVALAPVIAILWIVFRREFPAAQRRHSMLMWPLSLLLLAALLLLVFIFNNAGFDTVPAYFGIEALIRSLAVLGGLTRITFSPETRNYFHPVFEDPWLPAMVALGIAVLSAAAWGISALLSKRSLAGFTLLVFVLLCLPYLQLVPAKPPSLVSDRYIALAIWPAILLIVMLAWRFKPLLRTVLLIGITLPWLLQTLERPRDWRNFETLVEADMWEYPGYYFPAFYTILNVQVHNGLYREAGETASHITSPEVRNVMIKLVQTAPILQVNALTAGTPDKAIPLLLELKKMLETPPAQTRWDTPLLFLWQKLGVTLANAWQFLSDHFPENVLVRYNAGLYLLSMHSYQDAEIHLRAASGSPHLPESLRAPVNVSLGIALIKTGRPTEAEVALNAALAQPQPDLRAYCFLAEVYKQTRRIEAAARASSKCTGRTQIEEHS